MQYQCNADKDDMLQRFLLWCQSNGMIFSEKVKVVCCGTSHRYGVLACEDINSDETLVEIPRSLLLTPRSSSINSRIKKFKKHRQRKGKRLDQTSGWIPLLISLMYEYMTTKSFWRPYLDLVPLPDDCGHPMFWTDTQRRQELAGLPLLSAVEVDLLKMKEEYELFAKEFMEQNRDLKGIELMDFNLYKQMVAFVMAYSFTEIEGKPSMVPMADIFNHHSNNNVQLVFRKHHLDMVSTQNIKKGDEVFNTFGKLGNAELLHMYGFTESDENPYDTVHISLSSVVKEILKRRLSSRRLLKLKVACLQSMDLIDDLEDGFTFTKEGIKNGPDSKTTLEILHMDSNQFYNNFIMKIRTALTPTPSTRFKSKFETRKSMRSKTISKRKRMVKGEFKKKYQENRKGQTVERTHDSSHSDPDTTKENRGNDVELRLRENCPRKRKTASDSRRPCRISLENLNDMNGDVESEQLRGDEWPCGYENRIEGDDVMYSFDRIREVFHRKWIDSIQGVASTLLAAMKEDTDQQEDQLTAKQQMARVVRCGQRTILKRILYS